MTQRNNQALHIAEFGEDQRPCVGHIVGVEYMKDVAAPEGNGRLLCIAAAAGGVGRDLASLRCAGFA